MPETNENVAKGIILTKFSSEGGIWVETADQIQDP